AGVVNTLDALYDIYDNTVIKKSTAYTAYVFDVFVSEVFASIVRGLELHILSKRIRMDSILLSDYFIANEINLVYVPPIVLSSLPQRIYPDLEIIIYAGEPCDKKTASLYSGKIKLFNFYGPTEACIYTTSKQIVLDEVEQIGRAIPNAKAYVLDVNSIPVPIGVVGELHIGGAGLARGYLNLLNLTAERFIANPFVTESDKSKGYGRLYKTGDLVRWLVDGSLEYIGRNDDQVKIRGYRIELAEIEYSLSQIAGIQQSCVLAKERDTSNGVIKSLVAYYVLDKSYLSENDADILSGWESLYDSNYENSIEVGQIKSDFLGWNSYITGKPIIISEMEQWRDGIINIIKKLNLGCVLEIGVGSGLLMYPLLSEVEKYVGLDISQTVINRHIKFLKDKNYNTTLYHLKADQIDQLPEGDLYSTIIINSVCQYFPSIKYFDDILEKSINILSEKGSIFFGDIRNYDLQKELIKEKFDYEDINYTNQDIFRIALKENELLISPNYFINLKNKYKNIEVNIFERVGDYVNELSKYRYDVVISFNGEKDMINITDLSIKNSVNNYNIPYLNQLNKDSILDKLTQVLPEYMIPAALVSMESFPLTINGKLDKRSLPDPDFSSATEDYTEPRTDAEILICGIWKEVL
ncbi:AMP-binding protein, partial [Flavobacterium araucananum]